MNKIKLTGISLLAAFSLVFTAPLAMAQTNDTSLVNSGDDVDINTTSTSNSSTNVTNNNSATIDQTVHTDVNTGGNESSRNLGSSSITTGNALSTTTLGVDANHNMTGIVGGSNSSSNLTDIINVGDNLDVNTNTNTNSAINVNNQNNASVDQFVWGHSNTGDNTSSRNFGGSTIGTGNATFGVGLDVDVNHNATVIGGGSENNGLVNSTLLTNSGDNTNINTNSSSNTSLNVQNYNSLNAGQFVHSHANSGGNTSERNFGGASTTTGNAGGLIAFALDGNANRTGIGLSSLSPWSSNIGDIINVGDDLNFDTNTNTNSSQNVENNNHLSSWQTVSSHSSSGYNLSERNLQSSSILSGGAGIGSGMSLYGNHNTTVLGGLWGALLSWLSM